MFILALIKGQINMKNPLFPNTENYPVFDNFKWFDND
jgi:hypothetical protein